MLDNPDQIILWQYSLIKINATLVFTWLVMALLVGGSFLITRRLSVDAPISAVSYSVSRPCFSRW